MRVMTGPLLVLATAVLAATGLLTTLAPPAQATPGPLTAITVGDPALPDGDYAVTLASSGSVSFTIGSQTFGCTSVTGTGYVRARTAAANPYLTITGTTFTGCTGALAFPYVFHQVCDLHVSYDSSPTVSAAFTDVVDGTLYVNNCLQMTGTGCSLTVGNAVDADFNEAIKATSPSKQDLVISGTGLTAQNVSGCFGLVHNGASFNLNLTFNVTSANGSVNFS